MSIIAIPLWTKGRVVAHAVVDAEFHWLRQWTWHRSANGYAIRSISYGRRGASGNVWMHRVVTGCFAWLEVDHINRNKLDNRAANLRMVTRSENMRNKPKYRNNSSGEPGVAFNKQWSKWLAYVSTDGKRKFLGYFKDKEAAVAAARQARSERGFVLT